MNAPTPPDGMPAGPPPRRHHYARNIFLAVTAAVVLAIVLGTTLGGGKPAPASPAAVSSPAVSTQADPNGISCSALDAAGYCPGDDPVATPATTPAQPTPSQPAVIARYSGTGSWNSPPFTISGDSPALTVVYRYSGNILPGETSGDNFIANLVSGSDSQSIANEIATAGGKTTTLYPDTSGGNSYHLTVTATGYWAVTVTSSG